MRERTSRTMSALVDEYVSCLSNKHTKRGYGSSLGKLKSFLAEIGRTPDESRVDPSITDDVIAFLVSQRDQHGLRQSSISFHCSVLKSFFLWLSDQEQVDFGPGDFMALEERLARIRGKTTRSRSRRVSETAIERLLETGDRLIAYEQNTDDETEREILLRFRNRALLRMLHSGIRGSELVTLCRHDLDGYEQAIKVSGKGGKQHTVRVDDQAWQALQDYLTARDMAFDGGAASEPLFARHDKPASGRILPLSSTQAVYYAVKAVASLSGVEEQITPDILRQRSTIVLKAPKDLAALKKSLDHASPESKEICACLDKDNLDAPSVDSQPKLRL